MEKQNKKEEDDEDLENIIVKKRKVIDEYLDFNYDINDEEGNEDLLITTNFEPKNKIEELYFNLENLNDDNE